MEHVYTVHRKVWTDRKGFARMSAYWQIQCSCGWRGTRISKPGRIQSKQRVKEWEEHTA